MTESCPPAISGRVARFGRRAATCRSSAAVAGAKLLADQPLKLVDVESELGYCDHENWTRGIQFSWYRRKSMIERRRPLQALKRLLADLQPLRR